MQLKLNFSQQKKAEAVKLKSDLKTFIIDFYHKKLNKDVSTLDRDDQMRVQEVVEKSNDNTAVSDDEGDIRKTTIDKLELLSAALKDEYSERLDAFVLLYNQIKETWVDCGVYKA